MKCPIFFLAVQNSSIGDLFTDSLTESLSQSVTFTFAIQRAILETLVTFETFMTIFDDIFG